MGFRHQNMCSMVHHLVKLKLSTDPDRLINFHKIKKNKLVCECESEIDVAPRFEELGGRGLSVGGFGRSEMSTLEPRTQHHPGDPGVTAAPRFKGPT